MADAHDCISSGLVKGPNGVGHVARFLSATRSLLRGSFPSLFPFRNRGLRNNTTTSCKGEHTYYSTAPQELWTELLPNDLQDLNFVSKNENNAGESSFVEVHELGQSDVLSLQFLAEGGQAHVYLAECGKFSTPVVVKRLKCRDVDLYELLRRMERLMKIRKENNSAICRVFGAGKDFVGNVWVVMERMAGDLRTLIDSRMSAGFVDMPFDYNAPMPFDYISIIRMLLHIAQGMQDLHRCDLIHADLKASNILVTPVTMDPEGEEVHGSQQALESMYFYVKIGDFESSDGVQGSFFWRAPEVLQALKNGGKAVLSRAADVYSYGMLCYELLTGRVPFRELKKSNYDVVLSGQRPELTAHVNLKMTKLLHACWNKEPRERPTWISIIQTLQEELMSGPPAQHQHKGRGRARMKMKSKIKAAATMSETANSVTSWEEVVAQVTIHGLERERNEEFATWKEAAISQILPEILPIITVITERQKALQQDIYITDAKSVISFHGKFAGSKCLGAFKKAWYAVKQNWIKHVGSEIGLREMLNKVLKPYNLLGPTAGCWINEMLRTSEEWQTFRTMLEVWEREGEDSCQMWKCTLRRAANAWESVYRAFYTCDMTSPEAFIAWQAAKNDDRYHEMLQHVMIVNIYLEVDNIPEIEDGMRSIAWKEFGLEEVMIRILFLENTIDFATHIAGKFKVKSKISNSVTSQEEVVRQETIHYLMCGRNEKFATWKKAAFSQILPEISPIITVITERQEALKQDICIADAESALTFDCEIAHSEVLGAFNKAWYVVKQNWIEHVGSEIGLREMLNKVLKPYNLLGPTAGCWILEMLRTSEEWQTFRTMLEVWEREGEDSCQMWKCTLRRAANAWESVYRAFYTCDMTSPEAFIAWQAAKNDDRYHEILRHVMIANIYLEVENTPKLEDAMRSIAWKEFELEEVMIRILFLENTIDFDTHIAGIFQVKLKISNSVTSQEEVVRQETIHYLMCGRNEKFATWKKAAFSQILPEISPIITVITERQEALKQDICIADAESALTFDCEIAHSEVLGAFNKAWYVVKQNWIEHVGSEIGLREMLNKVLKPYNLLGPTAGCWILEMLRTSEEWQTFRTMLEVWEREGEDSCQMWKCTLRRAANAWESVYRAFYTCDMTSPEAFIAWQAAKNDDRCHEILRYVMIANIYLEVENTPKLEDAMRSIAWKEFELEEVMIRILFLENTIDIDAPIATHTLSSALLLHSLRRSCSFV